MVKKNKHKLKSFLKDKKGMGALAQLFIVVGILIVVMTVIPAIKTTFIEVVQSFRGGI